MEFALHRFMLCEAIWRDLIVVFILHCQILWLVQIRQVLLSSSSTR